MQHIAPPQYSPDGQWWWNGRSWVRVTWAVQGHGGPWAEGGYAGGGHADRGYPGDGAHAAYGAHSGYDAYDDERTRRRTPGVLWVGLIALVALLLLAFGASLVNWASIQWLGIGGRATPSAPATAPPAQPATPAPTDTPQSGTSGVDGYQQIVSADAARFQAAGQNVGNRCAPGALAQGADACRAALRSMDDTVQGFQADLAGASVPACLQSANSQLRTALNEYHQGIQQELDGIDNSDLGAIAQGAGTLSDASSHAQNAAALLQNSC